jgi:hypothetical protein
MRREGRAKLASVAHLTHFPTLTNATRRDGIWTDPPDGSERRDPSKQPDMPVRRLSSLILGGLGREPLLFMTFFFS